MFFQGVYPVKEARKIKPDHLDERLATMYCGDFSIDLLVQWDNEEGHFGYLLDYSHQSANVKSSNTGILMSASNLADLSNKMRDLMIDFVNECIYMDENNSIDSEVVATQKDIGLISLDILSALIVRKVNGKNKLELVPVMLTEPTLRTLSERVIKVDNKTYLIRDFSYIKMKRAV